MKIGELPGMQVWVRENHSDWLIFDHLGFELDLGSGPAAFHTNSSASRLVNGIQVGDPLIPTLIGGSICYILASTLVYCTLVNRYRPKTLDSNEPSWLSCMLVRGSQD